ncbi:MAG: hypothetical protein HYY01_14645 [Chloroflexi bacterium]|nr:hypothetical protein [Chloroflexota bacterium]
MNTVIPLLSSLVSLVFAALVFDQYRHRHRPYQLVWTVGLAMYAVATFCEFATGGFGLRSGFYRGWYLFGAIYVAAYLGMGTLYLLIPRWVANAIMALLLLASLYALFKVATAPLDLSQLVEGDVLRGAALPKGVRLITPFFNVFGTIALVGGAIYSAVVFWLRKVMPHRVMSNVLIAAGAFLPALGGTFSRFGLPQFLYVLELLGIVVIFLGFLRSSEVFAVPVRRVARSRG